MEICCGVCKGELKEPDLIVMDYLNALVHRHCYSRDKDYIKDIGTYGHIKNKYSFFRDEIKSD